VVLDHDDWLRVNRRSGISVVPAWTRGETEGPPRTLLPMRFYPTLRRLGVPTRLESPWSRLNQTKLVDMKISVDITGIANCAVRDGKDNLLPFVWTRQIVCNEFENATLLTREALQKNLQNFVNTGFKRISTFCKRLTTLCFLSTGSCAQQSTEAVHRETQRKVRHLAECPLG